uniref:Uncharacterized protein n=1 Tax=Electrophorus electricus TaxID=8005 RepID=A0A4W4HEY1_ELEEL
MSLHSHLLHHISIGPECSGQSPYSETHPHHMSSELHGGEGGKSKESHHHECATHTPGTYGSWTTGNPTDVATVILLQFAGSSEPSTQSLSRSHIHTRGIQRLVIRYAPQLASSELSWQSLSPSQM